MDPDGSSLDVESWISIPFTLRTEVQRRTESILTFTFLFERITCDDVTVIQTPISKMSLIPTSTRGIKQRFNPY